MQRKPSHLQSNEELLSTLIGSEDLADELTSKYRIEDLADLDHKELGLTPAKYLRLLAGIEIGRRVHEARSKYELITRINSPSAAIEFCRVHFARTIVDCMQEEFHIVTLTTKLVVIKSHRITFGTLDASLVHPREVFRPAIKDSASAIILAHNHPSGDPTPSAEDHSVTRRMDEVGKVLGITVVDHIVMAKGGCVSIRES